MEKEYNKITNEKRNILALVFLSLFLYTDYLLIYAVDCLRKMTNKGDVH